MIKNIFVLCYLIVIIDPYAGINYDEINTYEIEQEGAIETQEQVPEESWEWCYLCIPPRFVQTVEQDSYSYDD